MVLVVLCNTRKKWVWIYSTRADVKCFLRNTIVAYSPSFAPENDPESYLSSIVHANPGQLGRRLLNNLLNLAQVFDSRITA